MKKYIYILFIIFNFFLFNSSVNAVDCDSNDINRLKQLSKRITYQYDYIGKVDYKATSQTYEVYFENLDNDFFVTIEEKDTVLSFDSDNQKLRIESGKRQFKIYSKKCTASLDYITIDLPKYNEYTETVFCNEHRGEAICDSWYDGDITEREFQKIVKSFEEKENVSDKKTIFDYIKDYLFIIIFGVVIIIILLVLYIKKRLKESILN